ncbi:MAG: thioesterase family protein [Kangiellaceae bacterium]|jgi:acyl-CoA thioesterase|nr:thioesterase family protein [Kangiellaceae bacterium]
MSPFDQLLTKAKHKNPFIIDNSWSQGRTVFGGLSASLLVHAMYNELTDQRPLRVVNINFIGPLFTDQEAVIEVEHLRDGKNVTHMMARFIQDGNVCVSAQACFAKERQSKVKVECNDRWSGKQASDGKTVPRIPKVTPKFIKHIDLCKLAGGWPFTGSKDSHITGWMKFRETPQQLSHAHIVALIDAWWPAILQMLRWPKPSSTLSWQLELLEPEHQLGAEEWLAYHTETIQAEHGYGHSEAKIYAADGTLIALSRQTDTVFD